MLNKLIVCVLLLILAGCSSQKTRDQELAQQVRMEQAAYEQAFNKAYTEGLALLSVSRGEAKSQQQNEDEGSVAPSLSDNTTDATEQESDAEQGNASGQSGATQLATDTESVQKPLQGADLEQALEYWQGLTHRYPKEYKVWVKYGQLSFLDRNFAQAIQSYDRALELNPKHCPSFNLRGLAERHSGSLDGAQSNYQQAIECAPTNADGYYNLGIIKDLYRNQLSEALVLYRKARLLLPEDNNLSIWIKDLSRRTSTSADDPEEIRLWYDQLMRTNSLQDSLSLQAESPALQGSTGE